MRDGMRPSSVGAVSACLEIVIRRSLGVPALSTQGTARAEPRIGAGRSSAEVTLELS